MGNSVWILLSPYGPHPSQWPSQTDCMAWSPIYPVTPGSTSHLLREPPLVSPALAPREVCGVPAKPALEVPG